MKKKEKEEDLERTTRLRDNRMQVCKRKTARKEKKDDKEDEVRRKKRKMSMDEGLGGEIESEGDKSEEVEKKQETEIMIRIGEEPKIITL